MLGKKWKDLHLFGFRNSKVPSRSLAVPVWTPLRISADQILSESNAAAMRANVTLVCMSRRMVNTLDQAPSPV